MCSLLSLPCFLIDARWAIDILLLLLLLLVVAGADEEEEATEAVEADHGEAKDDDDDDEEKESGVTRWIYGGSRLAASKKAMTEDHCCGGRRKMKMGKVLREDFHFFSSFTSNLIPSILPPFFVLTFHIHLSLSFDTSHLLLLHLSLSLFHLPHHAPVSEDVAEAPRTASSASTAPYSLLN